MYGSHLRADVQGATQARPPTADARGDGANDAGSHGSVGIENLGSEAGRDAPRHSPIIAIDPGTSQSAWLRWDGRVIAGMAIEPNQAVLSQIRPTDTVVIEGIESFGMAVGRDVFETVFWSGRFAERAGCFHRVFRRNIKLHLCGQARAKDANIRQALIDRFGPGKDVAIGRKATPGPLYGAKSHIWSALSVAVTYTDQLKVA